MGHPLQQLINAAEGFLVIGDSANERFPGFSYAAYTQADKRFYCLDLGGLRESRGPVKGGKVYTSLDELPDDVGELCVIWVKPGRAKEAVDLAKQAGCSQVWFSFQTGHRGAVKHARALGIQVVEIGRCPVYYLDDKPTACAAHTLMTRVSGSWKRPPQTDEDAERRELW